ncbi:hypothetical protein HAX54_012580, partial [Datura stramonium]|nr:hypothetical protein [Datura stramonium]
AKTLDSASNLAKFVAELAKAQADIIKLHRGQPRNSQFWSLRSQRRRIPLLTCWVNNLKPCASSHERSQSLITPSLAVEVAPDDTMSASVTTSATVDILGVTTSQSVVPNSQA